MKMGGESVREVRVLSGRGKVGLVGLGRKKNAKTHLMHAWRSGSVVVDNVPFGISRLPVSIQWSLKLLGNSVNCEWKMG